MSRLRIGGLYTFCCKFGPYLQDSAQWLKIRNRKYSQWAGREKFFEREREVDPHMTVWDSCVLACEDSSV